MESSVSGTPPLTPTSSLLPSPTHITAFMLNYALSVVQRSRQDGVLPEASTPLVTSTDLVVQQPPFSQRQQPSPSPAATEGIQTRFANHGHHLMNLAIVELENEASSDHAQTQAASSRTASALSRQLYIHAITYLLRALPADMTPLEVMEIGKFVPEQVLKIEFRRRQFADMPYLPVDGTAPLPRDNVDTSKLEEAVVQLIRMVAIALKVSTPVVIELVRRMAEKEQEYQLSRRALNLSVQLVDRMSKSPLGVRMLDLGVSLLGAVGKGLGEGLVILTSDEINKAPPSTPVPV
ncbi:uncharacterized protein V1518DRAFT_422142 [Limtongia smithiae]|uniref:uncharacterized protein n=1 Tax=Limtongia smithiae TaxID=1125753 RepID=UPI0034CFC406